MMDAMEVLDWGWCRRSAGERGTTAYLHPVAEQDSDRNPDRKNRRRKNGEGPASQLRETDCRLTPKVIRHHRPQRCRWFLAWNSGNKLPYRRQIAIL